MTAICVTEDYVSFETAKLLKEKGFDIPVWTRYENDDDNNEVIFGDKYNWNNSPMGQISAPTLQMAMKYLREVHKVLIVIDAYHADHWEGYIDGFEISIYSHASTIIVPNEIAYHTNYEEAVGAAIKYCLEKLI